jgi:hypothetical protein
MMPYTSHKITEMVAKVNMSRKIPAVDFAFHGLITCGRYVMEDIQPAVIPEISIAVMTSI